MKVSNGTKWLGSVVLSLVTSGGLLAADTQAPGAGQNRPRPPQNGTRDVAQNQNGGQNGGNMNRPQPPGPPPPDAFFQRFDANQDGAVTLDEFIQGHEQPPPPPPNENGDDPPPPPDGEMENGDNGDGPPPPPPQCHRSHQNGNAMGQNRGQQTQGGQQNQNGPVRGGNPMRGGGHRPPPPPPPQGNGNGAVGNNTGGRQRGPGQRSNGNTGNAAANAGNANAQDQAGGPPPGGDDRPPPPKMSREELEQRFQHLDLNGDGKITREEYEHVWNQDKNGPPPGQQPPPDHARGKRSNGDDQNKEPARAGPKQDF